MTSTYLTVLSEKTSKKLQVSEKVLIFAILISKFNLQRQTVSSIISQWLKDGLVLEINGYIHASEETALAF